MACIAMVLNLAHKFYLFLVTQSMEQGFFVLMNSMKTSEGVRMMVSFAMALKFAKKMK
jgi:hypothetical protein